ncbi:cytochrome c [Sagittula sp. NFXS13]|uniref:Mono/diheme cytochrome c family protein n=1 Tax=Sagittula marina TaxID=943940 RepID=A0A7W6GRF8_9RHOB|nr:cytochrome c [Sagittula marina]MBB3984662.1 mono/diheme cytochrome c family protein [Sagittula marina]
MRAFILAALGAVALSGCMEDGAGEMPGPQDGQALFMENCAVCHGEDAKGNGPLARRLEKAPKDLTLIELRHKDTFPRAKIMSIVDGYARSDMTGPGMPEFGALLEGDLVPFDSGDGIQTPTPRKLVALVEYLETVQQKR